MATRDLHNNVKVVQSIAPQAVSDDTVLTGVLLDHAGFESVEYVISAGALVDADATFTVAFLAGNASDGSDLAAVDASDILGAIPAITFANDNTIYKFGYIGVMRYSKVTITPVNNTSAASFSVTAVLSHARHAPVA